MYISLDWEMQESRKFQKILKLLLQTGFSLYTRKECHYLFYVLLLFRTSGRMTFHVCCDSENGWMKCFKTPGNLPCMQIIFYDICLWWQCSSDGCSCFFNLCNIILSSASLSPRSSLFWSFARKLLYEISHYTCLLHIPSILGPLVERVNNNNNNNNNNIYP